MDAAALLLVATVGGRAPIGSASVAPPLEISAQARRTCQTRPGRSGWSWRQVDGRRCWYRGRRRLAKSALAWAPERAPRPQGDAGSPARKRPAGEAPPAPLPKPRPGPPRPQGDAASPGAPSIWNAYAAAAPAPRPVRTIAYPEGEAWEPPPRLHAVKMPRQAAAARPPILPGLMLLLVLSLIAAGVVTAGLKTIAAAARPLR